MKAVILCGGFGSRLLEETAWRPKPMIEIGGRPILWHIMHIYAVHGVNEFIIALGYKGEMIKEYFLDFYAINNDITINLSSGAVRIHRNGEQFTWNVHLVDTGLNTQTGGRLKRLRNWIGNDETFMMTYGDGVADLDLKRLLEFHMSHGKLATVTSVRSPERFGRLAFEGNNISEFYEKPESSEGWISGGFFVLNAKTIDYIKGDETIWEREPIERLAHEGQLMGYRHYGFWSCMDTIREKNLLEELWNSEKPPWRIWE